MRFFSLSFISVVSSVLVIGCSSLEEAKEGWNHLVEDMEGHPPNWEYVFVLEDTSDAILSKNALWQCLYQNSTAVVAVYDSATEGAYRSKCRDETTDAFNHFLKIEKDKKKLAQAEAEKFNLKSELYLSAILKEYTGDPRDHSKDQELSLRVDCVAYDNDFKNKWKLDKQRELRGKDTYKILKLPSGQHVEIAKRFFMGRELSFKEIKRCQEYTSELKVYLAQKEKDEKSAAIAKQKLFDANMSRLFKRKDVMEYINEVGRVFVAWHAYKNVKAKEISLSRVEGRDVYLTMKGTDTKEIYAFGAPACFASLMLDTAASTYVVNNQHRLDCGEILLSIGLKKQERTFTQKEVDQLLAKF